MDNNEPVMSQIHKTLGRAARQKQKLINQTIKKKSKLIDERQPGLDVELLECRLNITSFFEFYLVFLRRLDPYLSYLIIIKTV